VSFAEVSILQVPFQRVVATTVITIDMRGWNIETDLIEKVSHPDKLMATIRKSHIVVATTRHKVQ